MTKNKTINSLKSMENQLKEDLNINFNSDFEKLNACFIKLFDFIIDVDKILDNNFEDVLITISISRGNIVVYLSKMIREIFGKGLHRLGLLKKLSLTFENKTSNELAFLSSIFLTAIQVFSDGNNRTGIYLFSLTTDYNFKFLINSYELLRPVYDLFLKGCGNYDSIICDSNKLEVILKVLILLIVIIQNTLIKLRILC